MVKYKCPVCGRVTETLSGASVTCTRSENGIDHPPTFCEEVTRGKPGGK